MPRRTDVPILHTRADLPPDLNCHGLMEEDLRPYHPLMDRGKERGSEDELEVIIQKDLWL